MPLGYKLLKITVTVAGGGYFFGFLLQMEATSVATAHNTNVYVNISE